MPLDHKEAIQALTNSQDNDEDNRDMVQEADDFVNLRGGMWESHIWNSWSDRPRYTLDEVNPVIDGIVGEMETMEFACKVTPGGGGATKELATAYAGIIRGIERMSKAKHIYRQASRVLVTGGLAGWRVIQQERENNPFMQDLIIDEINNFHERVWFDEGCIKRDASDAQLAFVLTAIPRSEYDELYPDASGISVGQHRMYGYGNYSDYLRRGYEDVIVGEFYEQRMKQKTFALMNNGYVYEVDDDYNRVRDELLDLGVEETNRRDVDCPVFYHRHFDGGDWLSEAEETAFRTNPVVPAYANYGLNRNHLIYWGAVEKLMDPQRILNYAESKKVAESALKPVEKTWIAKEQATSQDVQESLADSNTNTDPHQFYDHVDDIPQPFKPPASQPDAVLIETAASNKQYIRDTSNFNSALRGEGLSGQSGKTIQKLQTKGNMSNAKYFTAMEVAIGRTAEIIVSTFPIVYDTPQEVASVAIDGTDETVRIHDTILDRETGTYVTINDMSVGRYHLECNAGPAFSNQQQEAASNMLEASQVYPEVMQIGGDVFLRSLNSPALDIVADRIRQRMVMTGIIPLEQMSDQEKQMYMQMQQNKQPDPIEQANLGLAQAEIKKAEAQTMDTISKAKERDAKALHETRKMVLDLNLKEKEEMRKSLEARINAIRQQAEILGINVDTLSGLKEILGVDGIISPGIAGLLTEQTQIVGEQQDNLT